MSRARVTAWTLLVASGFALLTASTANAQDPLPKKDDKAFAAVRALLEQQRPGGIPQADLKAARESLNKFAKYYADIIAHPTVWKASQEFKIDAAPGTVPPPTLDGPTGIFREMDRYIFDFVPGVQKPNANPEPADYIRELGAAFDAAFRNLIETNQERIVRINAARALAHVARTGAAAHYTTITELLAAPETATEVRYYLFQAAAAVLSAYDPLDPKARKHSADPKLVGGLMKALEDCINNPALILPGYKAETATADQLAVLALVRRQAVKALGQVKFATLPGADGKAQLYPAYTLVRVAAGDPALVPAPGPAEAAEAVIGLCNMQPPAKGYNADVAVEAATSGLITFAKPRAGNPNDRTLPWRNTSLRVAEALVKWRPLFDPEYDITAPTKFDATRVPASLEALIKDACQKVLAPIEKGDAATPVELEVLRKRLEAMRGDPKRNVLLFAGVPETSLDFAAPAPPKDPKLPKDTKDPKDQKQPR
jgi:hypothetical protein